MFRIGARLALCIVALLIAAPAAQQAPAQTPSGPEGVWRGTLTSSAGSLRLAIQIFRAPDGLYTGTLISLDQGSVIPISRVIVEDGKVVLDVAAVKGRFEGTLNADRSELTGTWTQGPSAPLVLTRDAAASATASATVAAPPASAALYPFGLPLDLEVPVPPAPFAASAGGTVLAWELHITNFGLAPMLISRLEVLDGSDAVLTYEGVALNGLLAAAGAPTAPDRRVLPPGRRVVAFLWLARDPPPGSLTHRITVDTMNVTGASVTPDAAPVTSVGPPLSGPNWIAGNGPSPVSVHRRGLIVTGGRAHLAQRFAIDWVRTGDDGRTFAGDLKDNGSYHAYGAEILAVVDATVTAVKDGIPENVPGPASRAVPITTDTVGGNHVVLDLGGGRFAFYGHLQPGSLRVKPGDRVTRGQVIGLVGNSGNSTEPHLHFHVSDGPDPLASEGLPFNQLGMEGLRGLPLQNARVTFVK